VLKALLPRLIEQHKIEFVIANGENAAGGFGITENVAQELFSYGIDLITTVIIYGIRKRLFHILQKSQES